MNTKTKIKAKVLHWLYDNTSLHNKWSRLWYHHWWHLAYGNASKILMYARRKTFEEQGCYWSRELQCGRVNDQPEIKEYDYCPRLWKLSMWLFSIHSRVANKFGRMLNCYCDECLDHYE